ARCSTPSTITTTSSVPAAGRPASRHRRRRKSRCSQPAIDEGEARGWGWEARLYRGDQRGQGGTQRRPRRSSRNRPIAAPGGPPYSVDSPSIAFVDWSSTGPPRPSARRGKTAPAPGTPLATGRARGRAVLRLVDGNGEETDMSATRKVLGIC